jgi:ABC-type polysaccharide/polyol phosphate transport system ATPase subunit
MSVISFENVVKQFDLYYGQKHILYAIKSFLGLSKKNQLFTALDNISFSLKKGDFLGLLGANGSGKSTILKLIAKITHPTSGKIITNGKVSALIELGIGFYGELTGLDNLILNAMLMGISKAELVKKIDPIIDFAEIRDFINVPVKRYSTGMIARLSFAISIHTTADILLIDEVLSVTDINFQMKCLIFLKKFNLNGGTIILASHSLDYVREFCNTSLLIDKGKLVYFGGSTEAIECYKQQHKK